MVKEIEVYCFEAVEHFDSHSICQYDSYLVGKKMKHVYHRLFISIKKDKYGLYLASTIYLDLVVDVITTHRTFGVGGKKQHQQRMIDALKYVIHCSIMQHILVDTTI